MVKFRYTYIIISCIIYLYKKQILLNQLNREINRRNIHTN